MSICPLCHCMGYSQPLPQSHQPLQASQYFLLPEICVLAVTSSASLLTFSLSCILIPVIFKSFKTMYLRIEEIQCSSRPRCHCEVALSWFLTIHPTTTLTQAASHLAWVTVITGLPALSCLDKLDIMKPTASPVTLSSLCNLPEPADLFSTGEEHRNTCFLLTHETKIPALGHS